MPRRERDFSPAPEGYTIQPIDPACKLTEIAYFAWVLGRGVQEGLTQVAGDIKLKPIQAQTDKELKAKIKNIINSGKQKQSRNMLRRFFKGFSFMEIGHGTEITVVSPKPDSLATIMRDTYFSEEK